MEVLLMYHEIDEKYIVPKEYLHLINEERNTRITEELARLKMNQKSIKKKALKNKSLNINL